MLRRKKESGENLLYKKFKINDERKVKRVVVKTAEPE